MGKLIFVFFMFSFSASASELISCIGSNNHIYYIDIDEGSVLVKYEGKPRVFKHKNVQVDLGSDGSGNKILTFVKEEMLDGIIEFYGLKGEGIVEDYLLVHEQEELSCSYGSVYKSYSDRSKRSN